ncbi:MAG: hypothetical protein HKN16_07590, partial [Saprospiraceae bacterium]|nr:hypothetical protein [Saprospiraceae bacterium]
MKKHLFLLGFILLLGSSGIFAQNNLSVSFSTIPDFLNVCGDPDNEVVTVTTIGGSPEIRSNVVATAQLFAGVEMVSFNATASSPGVSLLNGSDPTAPVFSLPDLDPFSTPSVDIALVVKSLCEYIDTLKSGAGIFDVVDLWIIDYDLGATPAQVDSLNTEAYRDALAFPIFNLQVNNPNPPGALGDCFSRTINLQNDGIEGFVDTLVYENAQGAGVYLTDVQINGLPVPFSKSIDVNGDTVITVNIGSTIISTAGDLDQFFDPAETLLITEDYCLMDCIGDRSSLHYISWGCEGRFCETVVENDFVQSGLGNPDAQAYETGSVLDVDAGYCQTGSTTITYVNEGVEIDAGFGTMIDVSTGISLAYAGMTGNLIDGPFEITEIYIAGILIPSPSFLIDLNDHPLFTLDPDGPGGLSDFDGDGFFDDLQVNESIEITASYIYDCSVGNDMSNNCVNELGTNFSSVIHFSNQCGDRFDAPNLNYRGVKHKKTEDTFLADSDAFLSSDTFFLN